MFKLIPIRKWRVPNALAIAAAFLLLVSSLTGVERAASPVESAASLARTQAEAIYQPGATPEPSAHAPIKQKRKFRVNLFLFRH